MSNPLQNLLLSTEIHTQIIAYHGWGFDAACWNRWALELAQQGYRLQPFDRGYFGNTAHPEFEQGNFTKLILTHSYGLHLCPIDQLQQAEALVIFGGFRDFHPEQASLRRRSQQILHQMIQQFEQNPSLVLANFRTKCYHPDSSEAIASETIASETMPERLNVDRLLADLIALNHATIDLAVLQTLPQIVILHGAQDRIVSSAKGQDLATRLPNSRYFEIETAGHALPFTHPELCWSILQPILETRLPV